MERMPELSVVVATYNRADTLRETLAHLMAQSLDAQRFEVIVVDDGSTDDTRSVVEAAQQHFRSDLRYLHHANRGPGYTQNQGLRAARAPIALLIADDIFLDAGALEAHLEGHRNHPEEGAAILGRVVQSPGLTHTVFLSKWDPWRLGDLEDGKPLPYLLFWACNISFKRGFMLRHGMFQDEMGRAGAAAHEDVELGYRLHQHGLRIHYGRRAFGYHHHVETLEGTLRRSRERGLNWHDFRLRVPHPEIDIAYRVYDLGTLWARRGELSGTRRPYLLDDDRSIPRLAMRHVLRRVLFNRWMVRAAWMPLFASAERHRWIAALVRSGMYRGVVTHHFLKGLEEGARRVEKIPRSLPVEER